MKIKRDFVTNSSSTSFIVRCESDAKAKDDFIDRYNGWRKNYIEERRWHPEFEEPPLLTSDMTSVGDGEFIITDFLPYYLNEQDAPQYIKELRDKDSVASKLLAKAGIKLMTVEMKDRNKPGEK
jgi:hypothetical protein